MIKTANEKGQQSFVIRFHQMGRGRYEQLPLSKALGSVCWRGVQEQRKISHGVWERNTEHLDQEKGQKEEPDSSKANGGRPANKIQDEQFTAVTRNTAGLGDHVEMVTEESRNTAALREKVFRKSQISESTWIQSQRWRKRSRAEKRINEPGRLRASKEKHWCLVVWDMKEHRLINRRRDFFKEVKNIRVGSEEIYIDWGQKKLEEQNESREIGDRSSRAFTCGKKRGEIPILLYL